MDVKTPGTTTGKLGSDYHNFSNQKEATTYMNTNHIFRLKIKSKLCVGHKIEIPNTTAPTIYLIPPQWQPSRTEPEL
jgi:hypothetical protein